jgi:tripartite-type tricarboxylate transporter receptor subunit TctC
MSHRCSEDMPGKLTNRRENDELLAVLTALLLLLDAGATHAQARYPERPIHLVVGFPPGSAVDSAARLIAPELAVALGQPVVVEDVAGAAGNVASDRVVRAPADGYTLAFATSGQVVVNPSLYRLPYDPIKALAPISKLVASPNLLVVPRTSPANTLRDLIALAKARPGALTYATGGVGSSPHLAGALLSSRAGLDIQHVPYKGVVAAVPDLLAGRLTMMFSPVPIVLPTIRDGRLRALATTSLVRTPLLPDVPSMAESGLPEFDVTVWFGLLAPGGTPATVVGQLQHETAKVLGMTVIREKLANLGVEVIGSSSEEFAAAMKVEIPFWADVIRRAKMEPE